MTIFLLKSLLSLLMLLAACLGLYTMYTVFGQAGNGERAGAQKRRHRIAGYVYIVLFLAVTYLCVDFTVATRTEPSPRAALHILLAFAVMGMLGVKMLFLRGFRQFYEQAKVLGTAIGITTFVLVGISAGYYLALSRFGRDRALDRSAAYALRGPLAAVKQVRPGESGAIRTDRRSIERGGALFAARCAGCHDVFSTATRVGPGLAGLLKRPALPASGHPATAESIRFQLRQPLRGMPSFAFLSRDEVEDLLAYLNTL